MPTTMETTRGTGVAPLGGSTGPSPTLEGPAADISRILLFILMDEYFYIVFSGFIETNVLHFNSKSALRRRTAAAAYLDDSIMTNSERQEERRPWSGAGHRISQLLHTAPPLSSGCVWDCNELQYRAPPMARSGFSIPLPAL